MLNDRTNILFGNICNDESIVKLALKMVMKGMSIEALADVLEVRPVTISNWLFRAAKQCEKVNEDLMKHLNVSKVEIDELWVIVKKVAPRIEIEDEGTWMCVTFAPKSRLILDFVL